MQIECVTFSNLCSHICVLFEEDISILTYRKDMKKYRCEVCDWIFDPAVGDPDGGIAPGTAFEDIPDDWVCPVCGVGKDEFVEE